MRVPSALDLQIVPEQPALERQRSRRLRNSACRHLACAQHLALHDEDVEVAVVVVVEQRDAGRHDLGVVELARTCR